MTHSKTLFLIALPLLPIFLGACGDASASLATEVEVGAGARLDAAPEPTPTPTPAAGAGATATDGNLNPDGTVGAASAPSDGDGEGDGVRVKEGFEEARSDLLVDADKIRDLKPIGDGASDGPEELEDGTLLISFADLSLVGYDVDALLDPEDDSEEMPESIQSLDGKKIAIEGYMLPMEWKRKQVISFMLVRDMAGCCFGGMPQPDEWIDCNFVEGKACDYFPYIPVLVTGTLKVGGELDDLGYVTGAYSIEVEHATDEW